MSCITNSFGSILIGVADAVSLDYELANLKHWLENNHNGQMAFLARSPERRCDPLNVLPECKSVIVAAMKYDDMPSAAASSLRKQGSHLFTLDPRVRGDDSLPKYLRHNDYHKVMMQKMEAIAAEIKKEEPTAMCKCYVDTGPVLEKAWAARAGIGFIGKNTLLISPEYGSQMALGVVLTSYPLLCKEGRGEVDIDPTLTLPLRRGGKACGSCRKCLDACPTGALVAPYTLDARKCISYKFFIAKEEGGCDICQDVCPFNKR